MCPNQLTAAITALAAVIAGDRSDKEIALLAAVFTQLGDTLTTIAAQQALLSCCGQPQGAVPLDFSARRGYTEEKSKKFN